MIKNRHKEGAAFITAVIAISLFLFYIEGKPIEPSVTGHAIHSEKEASSHVILSGIEFRVIADGKEYLYMFADDGWYESKDRVTWEKREDMEDDLWKGLRQLQEYGVKIYYDDVLIDDIAEFARDWR